MESSEGHESHSSRTVKTHPRLKSGWFKKTLPFVLIGIVGLLIGLWMATIASERPHIPAEIRKQATFPVHEPTSLPSNYQLDKTSFVFDQGTLVYQAINGAGGRIAFTEQPKPENFNFDDFYKEQVEGAKNIDSTPFPSVWGKGKNQSTILSVVTDKTWILVSTTSPLGEVDMKRIAQGIEEQE